MGQERHTQRSISDAAVVAGAKVIHTFKEAEKNICGITLLNNELYTICPGYVDQVRVYSTSDFKLLRCISVPDLDGARVDDMTSCEKKQCIYLADNGNSRIYRVVLDSSVNTWPVNGKPRGLSVTRCSNLLVTCCDLLVGYGKLLLLRSDSGKCVEEIALESDIKQPWHAVQLSHEEYIVCHGFFNDSRLVKVNADGAVTQRNTGGTGLSTPRHVAVDSDKSVFVADGTNFRIVLLDPSLSYVRSVIEQMQHSPQHLCFDNIARRLYMGQYGGIVSVVQL